MVGIADSVAPFEVAVSLSIQGAAAKAYDPGLQSTYRFNDIRSPALDSVVRHQGNVVQPKAARPGEGNAQRRIGVFSSKLELGGVLFPISCGPEFTPAEFTSFVIDAELHRAGNSFLLQE